MDIKLLTVSMFSKSLTYTISPLTSSKITLEEKGQVYRGNKNTETHDCRWISSLVMFAWIPGAKSCHCHFPVTPRPIADWKVRSWATPWRFFIASIAARRYSASGLSRAVSFKMAFNKTGYFWRCSEGRFKKCRRSRRRAPPESAVCCREHFWIGDRDQCISL